MLLGASTSRPPTSEVWVPPPPTMLATVTGVTGVCSGVAPEVPSLVPGWVTGSGFGFGLGLGLGFGFGFGFGLGFGFGFGFGSRFRFRSAAHDPVVREAPGEPQQRAREQRGPQGERTQAVEPARGGLGAGAIAAERAAREPIEREQLGLGDLGEQ